MNNSTKLLPGWQAILERGGVIASLILACLLFVSLIAKPSVIADPSASSIATAGLLVSSVVGGWLYTSPVDRSAAIGAALGLPMGFFYFQNSYARSASIGDLASGSARIMLVSALAIIVSSAAGWFYRRRLSGNQR